MITNSGLSRFFTNIAAGTNPFASGTTYYLGLTADATAPAQTDNALASELSGSGLSRVAVNFAAGAGGTYSWVVGPVTFTYTGSTSLTINKFGIFDAASAGNLLIENAITPVTVNVSGDYFTVTETVTV